jgi:translocation and assembly module TamB
MTQPAGPVRSKHWHVSKPVRVIACFFGAMFLGYLVLVAVISTKWFNRVLLEDTRAEFERVTGARVEIGQMQVNPWVLQATFSGLVMHGNETGEELPLFAARELVVRASPRALFHRRSLRVARVDLEGAAIHLYTRPDGSTNLPGPAVRFESLTALDDLVDLGVGRLLIAQSSFSWDNRQWPLAVSARDLAVVIGMHRGSYAGSVSAVALDLSRSEVSLPAVTVSARVAFGKNSLQLDSLTWRSPGLSGSGAVALRWIPSVESRFSFSLNGEAAPLARIFRRKDIRQGTLSTDGEGSYRDGSVDAHGRLKAHGLLLSAPRLESRPIELSADYVVQGQQLRFPRLTASLLGGTASGSAEVSFAARLPAFEADLDLQNFDLVKAMDTLATGSVILKAFPVVSRAYGKLQLSGRGTRAESHFDLRLDSSGLEAGGREPLAGFMRGSATFGPEPTLELESAELQITHSILKVHGSAGESSANLAVDLETTDFGEWSRSAEDFAGRPLPVRLDSPAHFTGTLTGSLARPLLAGHLQLGAFEYQSWKWNSLQADVAVGPGELRVTSGRLLGAGSALAIEATATLENWQYRAGAPFEVSARADKTSIQGLREVLGVGTPLDGEVTGELHLKEHRNQLAGEGSFFINRGSYAGEHFDSLDAGIAAEAGVWKLNRFTLKKHHGVVTASASFDPATRALSARTQGDGIVLADFTRLQKVATPASPSGPKGTLSFNLQIEGSLDSPSAHGDVQVQDLRMGDIALGDLTGHLQTSGREATLKGQLQGPGGTLDFQGNSQVGTLQNPDWPVRLSAHYTGLRLDPWLRTLGVSAVSGTVEATGSVDYSGTLSGTGPRHVKSEVQSVKVSFAGLQWRNDHPFDISLDEPHFEITSFDLQGPSTEFRFQGTGDLGPIPVLNLRADGQIDSQFLHVFDPALQTTGRFGVQVQVQGSFRQPLLYGSLHMDEVSIGYPGLPLRLAGLNGDVDLQGDRLTVRSLRAQTGPASVTITGSATLSGTPRYSLQADFSHMRVAYPVQFTSVISGAARLSGTKGAGVLTGDLTVEQMFVSENFNVLNWAAALATGPASTLENPSPLSSGVRMDVHVTSSPTVSVDSHDLSAVAAIDLSLRGTLADPVVFGNVHIQSGQAVLRQTSYKLTHGDVIMANPLRTEPTLDLEATTRIERYELVLRITGPADRPRISYRSDPPLSTPGILALLAFGYSTQDQLIANTGRSSFSTEGASALLSQALSSQKSSRVTRLFGLSRISIDPSPVSTGGTQVTVEERLAPDLAITYVTTTGGVLERIIRVEWDVSDTVSVLGIRDQNGVYGFELDFRRRFK